MPEAGRQKGRTRPHRIDLSRIGAKVGPDTRGGRSLAEAGDRPHVPTRETWWRLYRTACACWCPALSIYSSSRFCWRALPPFEGRFVIFFAPIGTNAGLQSCLQLDYASKQMQEHTQ
jgi:hypothetical protein